jgi:hypothetical protein
MPFDLEIDKPGHIVVLRGSGSGSVEEIEASVRQFIQAIADGTISTGDGLIIGVDATALEPTAQDVNKIGQLLSVVQGCLKGPVALVASVAGKVLPANLIAMYAGGVNNTVQTFTREADARAWLASLRTYKTGK